MTSYIVSMAPTEVAAQRQGGTRSRYRGKAALPPESRHERLLCCANVDQADIGRDSKVLMQGTQHRIGMHQQPPRRSHARDGRVEGAGGCRGSETLGPSAVRE